MPNPVFVLRAKEDPTRGAYRTLFRPELPVKGTFLALKGQPGYKVLDVSIEKNAAFGIAPLAEIERLLALPDTSWKPMCASDTNDTVWLD